jgi:predicted phage terminase large subunit-like protein
MRDLVQSEWYRTLWPHVVLMRDNEIDFENTARGGRRAMPFASLTSGRGNRVVLDDPHSTEQVESEAERERATRLFRESVTSRLNDPVKDAILVIMHRLHPQDVCGTIERLGLDYVKLVLPMEYEPSSVVTTRFYDDPRRYAGELLCPERIPRETVDKNKTELGSHAFATQYQQHPSAREGGMFKRHWFKIVDAIPAEAMMKVRRWDLAGSVQDGSSDPDWTVGLKMATLPASEGNKFYIEDVVRFRETGASVRKAIKTMASHDGIACTVVIPQDPGQAGKEQAASIIGENAGSIIVAERETGPKATRAEPLAAQCEAGNVYLLRAPWNETFIEELCSFPQGHDDQVDAAAGAFNRLRPTSTYDHTMSWVFDKKPDEEPQSRRRDVRSSFDPNDTRRYGVP